MWIFSLAFLLDVPFSVQSFTVSCARPVVAEVNRNITLFCRVDGADLNEYMVKWSVQEGNKEVFILRKGVKQNQEQHAQFKQRTDIHKEGLKEGNIKLTISNIALRDEGNYTCSVSNNTAKAKGNIALVVKNKDSAGQKNAPTTSPVTTIRTTAGSTNPAVYYGPVLVILGAMVIGIPCFLWKKGLLRSCSQGDTGNGQQPIPLEDQAANNMEARPANQEAQPLTQEPIRRHNHSPRNQSGGTTAHPGTNQEAQPLTQKPISKKKRRKSLRRLK